MGKAFWLVVLFSIMAGGCGNPNNPLNNAANAAKEKAAKVENFAADRLNPNK